MSYALIHVHDLPSGPDEEAYVIVPGGEKVAIAVPIDAVGRLAPILARSAEERPVPCCEHCGEKLPSHRRNR